MEQVETKVDVLASRIVGRNEASTDTSEQPVDVLAVRYYVGHVQAQTEFAAVSTGQLTGLPVFKEVPGDPVLGGRFKYIDGGWDWVGPCPQRPIAVDPENLDAPVCVSECRYRQPFGGFDRQRNALRMELASLVQRERCGWNLLPGRIGGHPLDYAPCTALARVGGGK